MPHLKKLANSLTSSESGNLQNNDDEEWSSDAPDFIVVTDVLDLHGTSMKIIPEMINEFLDNAAKLRLPLVQIIHGKGKSRPKHIVLTQLSDDERVIKFYDAPPRLGAAGDER